MFFAIIPVLYATISLITCTGCLVELQSSGLEVHGQKGHLKINNNLEYDSEPDSRGFHLFNLILPGCTLNDNITGEGDDNFEIYEVADSGKPEEMRDDILRFDDGTILLGYAAHVEGWNNAIAILGSVMMSELGVDVSSLQDGEKIVFGGVKGAPQYGAYVREPDTGSCCPLKVTWRISEPGAEPEVLDDGYWRRWDERMPTLTSNVTMETRSRVDCVGSCALTPGCITAALQSLPRPLCHMYMYQVSDTDLVHDPHWSVYRSSLGQEGNGYFKQV